LRATLLDEMRDSVRQHARLARTSAGDHEQRARFGHDGITLGRIQSCERVMRHPMPT
jgi:hypothetical protein